MGGGKDAKQTGATEGEIRAHVLRKLKEARSQIKEGNRAKKNESAGGQGTGG